jgi:DNA phosphorothioation-dependent restriction protein DptG
MAEANGHRDNPSRLDRMEKMVEYIVNGHIVLEDKLGRLTEKVDKLSVSVETLRMTVVLQASTMRARLNRIGAETDALLNRFATKTDARLNWLAAEFNRRGAEADARIDRLAALIESITANFINVRTCWRPWSKEHV